MSSNKRKRLVATVSFVSAGATDDKWRVGARVGWSGVGIALKNGQPTEGNSVMPSTNYCKIGRYRDRARTLVASSANTDARATIAQFVEATIAEDAGFYMERRRGHIDHPYACSP
jgi:hypothetical protein